MIMKKMTRFFAMALMAGAMFTACGDDKGGETPPPTGGGGIEGVTVDNKLSGSVKAGFAGAIEIMGSGFDPVQDWVFIGYDQGGEIKYERITTDLLTIKSGRISFGVPISATYLDKTFKVYLDRATKKMELTNDLTFTMPTVEEGYIPDPYFRATLMSTHPQQGNVTIAPLFDAYGLLDVAGAATIESVNIYGTQATSLEGIELFKGATRLTGNDLTTLKVADFSKWKSSGPIFVNMERATALEEVIGGPSIGRLDCYNCDKLTKVDMHLSRWQYNFQLFSSENGESNVTYLDIRKLRTGTEMGGPEEGGEGWKGYCHSESEWCPLLAGAWFRIADNSHVLVDYQFLVDKWGGSGVDGSGYNCIYSAWTRGATIDVYSSKNIEKKLGTVPMYKDDSGALTLTGANGWVPAETE